MAVTVILALIVLNTGVLANLSDRADAKAAQLEATVARFEAIQEEIEAMTDANYIIDVAQNQYGMVKKKLNRICLNTFIPKGIKENKKINEGLSITILRKR